MGPEDRICMEEEEEEEKPTVPSGSIPGLDLDNVEDQKKVASKKVPYR